MKVTQISVFIENTPGRLAEVAKSLGKAKVNILALTIAETGEFGVLRMITNDTKKAVAALRKSNFTTSTTEVLAIEIPNKPGSLSKVVDLFQKEKINIEYVYAFVEHKREGAVIVMRFEDTDKALKALKKNKISVLTNAEVIKIES